MPNVQHFPAASVAAAFGKDPLVDAANHRVQMARRTEAGECELHDHVLDVFYILDGAATFITGGTMIAGREIEPGDWRGSGIEGGETHELRKGDVILIPAGTPHWFQSVPERIDYFIVKVMV